MLSIRKIIKGLDDMAIGESRDMHHCHRNPKLGVKRVHDGWLYNCFHCGEHGIVRDPKSTSGKTKAVRADLECATEGERPTYSPTGAIIRPVGEWPVEARVWVLKYIERSEVEDAQIFYDPSISRVVLPVMDDGTLVGYQTRRVHEFDSGPKYRTYKRDAARFFHHVRRDTDVVVLCEDILSAIRIARFTSSAAILGTSVSDVILARLTSMYSKFLIFLDDDNAQVKMAQRRLKKRLDIFGECGIILTGGVDPKELSDSELARYVT